MIYHDYPLRAEKEPRALAMGFFDGVHLGHQALLAELEEQARTLSLQATVFTFDRAPASIFAQKGDFPGHLMSMEERYRHLSLNGQADIVAAPLIPEVYQLPAEKFLQLYLREWMDIRSVIAGEDFSFGHKAGGNCELLRQFCRQNGIELRIMPEIAEGGQKISSTRIRALVKGGRLREAAHFLGRPYSLGGRLRLETAGWTFLSGDDVLLPPPGSYEARLWVDGRPLAVRAEKHSPMGNAVHRRGRRDFCRAVQEGKEEGGPPDSGKFLLLPDEVLADGTGLPPDLSGAQAAKLEFLSDS